MRHFFALITAFWATLPSITRMARPKKKRFCEGIIAGQAFKPTRVPLAQLNQVELYYDEIEALRLCDLEGLTQAQAGIQMGISRGTVQRILTSARKKMASAIVNGEALILTGNDHE